MYAINVLQQLQVKYQVESLFLLSDKHNRIDLLCYFYSTPLRVVAVHFSHYHVGHQFTKRVKGERPLVNKQYSVPFYSFCEVMPYLMMAEQPKHVAVSNRTSSTGVLDRRNKHSIGRKTRWRHLKKCYIFTVFIAECNLSITGVLISPQPEQEGNKLQRQKILMFIYLIYNHNWRNISTIYIYMYIYIYIYIYI